MRIKRVLRSPKKANSAKRASSRRFGFGCPRFRRDRLGSLHASACSASFGNPSELSTLSDVSPSLVIRGQEGRVAFLQESQTGRILSDEGMKPHRNRSSINLRCLRRHARRLWAQWKADLIPSWLQILLPRRCSVVGVSVVHKRPFVSAEAHTRARTDRYLVP